MRTVQALVTAACLACSAVVAAQSPAPPAKKYTVPRTPWGDPDLQGIWPGTPLVGVPLQRDPKLGTRNVLTDEEFAERKARYEQQSEEDNADFDLATADVSNAGAVGSPTSPPPHWLERGEPQRQASLIIDPPDGRMPPLTAEARQRQAAMRAARQGRGPADSYTDESNYVRCITRGLVSSMLPTLYNFGNQIMQAPGYVVIRNEMIHETRVVPLDGRAHVGAGLKMWMGDSRGHFEGDTLVVETTNFTDRTGIGPNGGGTPNSDALTIVERFTPVGPDSLDYRITVNDPKTWTRPWTILLPLKRDNSYGMFEYACHEGNHALVNILSGARAQERKK